MRLSGHEEGRIPASSHQNTSDTRPRDVKCLWFPDGWFATNSHHKAAAAPRGPSLSRTTHRLIRRNLRRRRRRTNDRAPTKAGWAGAALGSFSDRQMARAASSEWLFLQVRERSLLCFPGPQQATDDMVFATLRCIHTTSLAPSLAPHLLSNASHANSTPRLSQGSHQKLTAPRLSRPPRKDVLPLASQTLP
ncbi:hypothetical protein LY76DRAFT_280498 [Colletotrichum caudatum]|nr:hypothetical protein LY76DRAFT_280498 [Colletotrichum caudatum]